MGPLARMLLVIPAAVSFTEFNGITAIGPFSDAARIDEKLFIRDLGVTQCQRRKLAVLAIAAGAVDDDLLGGLAHWKNCPHVILGMIVVELISTRNMSALIMLVVASVDENNRTLLVKRTME